MKKYQNQNSPIKKPPAVILVIQSLALLLYAVWAVVTAVSGFSGLAAYDMIIRCLLVVNCVVLFIAVPFYMRHLSSKLFNSVAWAITLAVGLGSVPYVVGGIKDSLGYICTGFFGVRVSCVEGLQFFTSITLFSPLVFTTLLVLTTLVTVVGIFDAKRQSDRN
jgi:hypothetical protein